MTKIQSFPLRLISNATGLHMQRTQTELNCNQTITVSWEEHRENLVSIQHIYYKRNTFSFRNHEV